MCSRGAWLSSSGPCTRVVLDAPPVGGPGAPETERAANGYGAETTRPPDGGLAAGLDDSLLQCGRGAAQHHVIAMHGSL
jgi:hypothetical protein